MNSDASNPQESSQSSILHSSKSGPMNPSNGDHSPSAPETAPESAGTQQERGKEETNNETPVKSQTASSNGDSSDFPSAEKKTADLEMESESQKRNKDDDEEQEDEIVCSACGFESSFVPEGMISCEMCKTAFYCSDDCRTWHWDQGGHKKACREARTARRRADDQLAESSQHSALLKSSSHSAVDLFQGSTSTGIDSTSSNQQSMAVSEIFEPQNTSSSGLSASGLWENERLTNTSGHSIELVPRKEKSSAASTQQSRLSDFFEQQQPLHQQQPTTSFPNPYLTQRSTTARGNNSLRGSNHKQNAPTNSQESDPEVGTDPSSSEGNNSSSWSSDHSKPRMGASGHANSSLLGSNAIPAFSNGAGSEYTEEEVFSDEERLNDHGADEDADEFAEDVIESDSEESLDIMKSDDEDDESVLQSIIEEVSENPDEEPEKEGSWRSRELYDDEAMKKAHASVASMLDTADEALASNSQAGPDISQSEDTSDHIYEIVDVVEYSTNTENTGATEDTEIVYISGKEYKEKYKNSDSATAQQPPVVKKRKTTGLVSSLPSASISSHANSVDSNDFKSLLGDDNNEESSNASPMNSLHLAPEESTPLPSQSQRTNQSSEPTEENYESFALDTSHQVSISQNQSEHMSESAGSFASESDSENKNHGDDEPEKETDKRSILGLPSVESNHSNEERDTDSGVGDRKNGESGDVEDTHADQLAQMETFPSRRRSSNNSSGNMSLELYSGSEDFDLDDADEVRKGSLAKKTSLKDFREAYSRADSFSSENYKDFRQVYADRSVGGEQTVGSRSSRSHTGSSGGSKSDLNRSIGDLHKDLPNVEQVPDNQDETSKETESSGRRGSMSRSEALKVSINKALRDYEKLYGEEAARGAFEKLAQAVLNSDETPQTPTKSVISTQSAPVAETNGSSTYYSATSSVNTPSHVSQQSPASSKSQHHYFASPASSRSAPSRGVVRSLSGQSYSSWALPTDYSVFSTNLVSDSSANKLSPEPPPPQQVRSSNDGGLNAPNIGQRLSSLRDQADQMKTQATSNPQDYRNNMVLTNSDDESNEEETPKLAESSVSSEEDVARLGALPQQMNASDGDGQIPPNHTATATVMRIMSPPRDRSHSSKQEIFSDEPEPEGEDPGNQSASDGSISLTASSGQGDEGPRYLKYRSLLSKGALAISDAAARMLNFATSEDSGEPHAGSGSTRTPTSSPEGEDFPESPYEEYRRAPFGKALTPDRISLTASSAEVPDSSPRYLRYRNLLASNYTPDDCPSDAELGLDANADANTPERSSAQRTLDPWAPVETPERVRIDLQENITAESPRYLQYRTSLAKRIAVLRGTSDIDSDDSSSDESTDSKKREVKDLESRLSSLEAQLHSYLNKGSVGKESNQSLDERMAEYLKSDDSRRDMKEQGRRNSWVGVGMDFSSSNDDSMASDGSPEHIIHARMSPGNKKRNLKSSNNVAQGATPYLQFDASMHDSDYTKINESASVSLQDDDGEIDVEKGLEGKAPRGRGMGAISPTPSEKKIGNKKFKQNKFFWCAMFACLLVAVPVAIVLGVLLHDDGGNASIGRSSAVSTPAPVPPQGASSAPISSPPASLFTSSPTLTPFSDAPSLSPPTGTPTISIAPTSTPSSSPSLEPSSLPSSSPTTTQSPSAEPTPGLQFPDADLLILLSEASFDDGAGLQTRNSPQYRAYLWLAGRDLTSLSDAAKIQRYAVAVIFYSLGGEQWNVADRQNWLEVDDECAWTYGTAPCDVNGVMTALDLGFYDFQGSIPLEIGHLSELREVNLSGKNGTALAGILPLELTQLSHLESFVAPNNQIQGPIPDGLNWPLVKVLDLSSNMLTDSIPDDISLMASLESFNLAHNKVSGFLTESIGSLANLEFLDILDNNLEGAVPSTIGSLLSIESINLSQNGFTSLPSSVGSLVTLKNFQAHENDLSGQLFDNWGSLDSLETLVLRDNDYEGPIPPSLGGLASIQTLDLSFNMFSEEIPNELGNLSTVLYLFLNSNKLSGAIPAALQGLQQIDFLRLDDNDLQGAVPTELCATLGNNQVPRFFSDCDVISGNGEIQCPLGTCCTHCCAGGPCVCIFEGTNLDFLCFT